MQTVYVQRESNSIGVVGFCMMILGWLTCGLLSIPAMIVCGFAMNKEPRGLAIAGLLLSLPGAAMSVVFLLGLVFSAVTAASIAEDNRRLETQKAKQAIMRSVGK